jgi:aminoglycoside phosphotransferase family enzyme/predicted kinase
MMPMRLTSTIGLPETLMDPAAYADRPESLELRETHISWVFLADAKAYKVKKPVRLPFLDYGTLERRRECCRAELRLNRRFAPDLYREVVALVPRGPHGLAVAAEDDPRAVEYAVVMDRYDESKTLLAGFAHGMTDETDLVAVGAAIAGFHAAAPAEPAGGTGRLTAVIEETLATLAAAGAPPRRLADLTRFCGAALTAFGPELANREAAGLVRDGHGDLRAEHVLLGVDVHAVDGVEFDRDLRIADVGYDLAFLIMDVARRDDDLARALLRGYRAAGGDPGSEALVAFFCAVRALIRTKVDFLRAGQLIGAAADDRTARALELLAVAERFAWRTRLPRVVCVIGLAASGKSTLAEALAASAGRTVLSSDRTRKLRAGIDPYEHAAPSAYGDAESHAVYAELALRAAAAVRREGGAIVDATFRRAGDADAFAATSPTAGGAAWIVCKAPLAVRLERAHARELQASVSDAGPAIIAAEVAVYGTPFLAPAPPVARLDTTQPIAESLARLSDVLDARLQASVPCPQPLHVVPDAVGGWHVQREGEDDALSAHNSATDAERAAVRNARATATPQVLVHDRYDRIHQAKQ